MKALVIIISVLAVIMVVYGFNEERLRMFQDHLKRCAQENGMTGDTLNSEVALCTTAKDGKILNANGEYIREEANKGIRDLISEANKTEKALGIYNKCHDEADKSGVTGNEQAKKITTCILPLFDMLHKI